MRSASLQHASDTFLGSCYRRRSQVRDIRSRFSDLVSPEEVLAQLYTKPFVTVEMLSNVLYRCRLWVEENTCQEHMSGRVTSCEYRPSVEVDLGRRLY